MARLGGDEFGVILNRVVSEDEATVALHRLLAALGQPLDIAGLPLTPEASIGFALIPDDGADAETLMQHADVAMYLAKVGHIGVVRYDPAQDDYDSDRLGLVAELRRAIGNDELVLHYQPKETLTDGSVRAVEALIRWNHPRHGLLFPDAFLPVAEQTGLIDALTDWVVDAALQPARRVGASTGSTCPWPSTSPPATCPTPASPSGSRRRSCASPVPTGSLIVEITETALLTDVERATDNLVRLAACGVPVSIDDFGRGQTSLGYLSRLPLHELKIDRSFVTDLLVDAAHAAIVRSVVELSHNLGLVVVAEGVEDEATLARLRELELRPRPGLRAGPPDARGRGGRGSPGVRRGRRRPPSEPPAAGRLAWPHDPDARRPRHQPRALGSPQRGVRRRRRYGRVGIGPGPLGLVRHPRGRPRRAR